MGNYLRKCLSASLDEIAGRKTVKPKRADRLQKASLADQGKTGQALQWPATLCPGRGGITARPVGEPSPEEVEQRTAEQKRIQTELRKDQLQHLLDHADSYVKQGKLSAEEAEKLLQFNKVEEAERKGSISEEKGERIRNSIMDRTVRYELDRKVREATDYAVSYIQVFESMKKINPKYDQALRFLIQYKEFVNADKDEGLDPTPIIESLIGNLDCLKQLIDLMDRQDAETRMMFARMPPYSYVVKRGQDRLENLVIEEGFVESLRQVERDEIVSRLNAEDRQLRVRPAADMRCLYSLLQRVVKATPIRREIRILKINMIVEEFYRSTDDLEEARGKALEFLNSRLRGLYPDLSAEETSAINERSAEIIDQVEKKILAERGSQQEAVAEKDSESRDDALSAEEEAQGAQIGRVALRVAGKRRLMSYSSCYAAPLYLVIDLVRRIQDIGVKQVIS
jgi:polyhydroxyalkanoate synthesis regulator phasin